MDSSSSQAYFFTYLVDTLKTLIQVASLISKPNNNLIILVSPLRNPNNQVVILMENYYQEFNKDNHQLAAMKSGFKKIFKVINKGVYSRFLSWKIFEPYEYEIIDYDMISRGAILCKFQKLVLRKTLEHLKNANKQIMKRMCLSKLLHHIKILKIQAFMRLKTQIEVLYNSTTTVEIVKNITIVEKYVRICEDTGNEIVLSQITKNLVEKENDKGEILAPAEVLSEKIEDFFAVNTKLESKKSVRDVEAQTEFSYLDFPVIQKNPEANRLNIIQNKVSIIKKLASKLSLSAALIILIAFIYKKLKPLMHI